MVEALAKVAFFVRYSARTIDKTSLHRLCALRQCGTNHYGLRWVGVYFVDPNRRCLWSRIRVGGTVERSMGGARPSTCDSSKKGAAIPSSTPKMLYEMALEGHFSWGTPRTHDGELGAYALAFQKVFLLGDERYRRFLRDRGARASDFRSNIR